MQSGVTQLKLEMHEYKEMGLSVGDKVFLELSKAETLRCLDYHIVLKYFQP